MPSEHDRPPYAPGDIVGQKYRIQKILGEGGMAVVYDAVDTTCDRRVALKVIRPSYASHGKYSNERMRREAEVLVRLHEKTESVVDVLTAGITEDDHRLPYYIMERLRGDTLRQFLSDQRARGVDFTLDEVTGIAIPIAMALSHAHALGVVHRDTKPENVFMAVMRDKRVVVKMLDFGICATESDGESNTFAGTLSYAAPEQLEGKRPLTATDVYALGLVLFELLTQKLPHGRHRNDLTLPRLAMAVLKNPVPDLGAIRLDAPPRLVQLVASCLALDPAVRPSSHDVAKVLRDVKLVFLGEITGARHSTSAATDVTGPPIAMLQAQLEAASATRPEQIQVFQGSSSVDPRAQTDLQAAPGRGGDEDFVLCRSPPLETADATEGAAWADQRLREGGGSERAGEPPSSRSGPRALTAEAPLLGAPVITLEGPSNAPVPAVVDDPAPAAEWDPVQDAPDRLAANQFVRALIAQHRERSDEELSREAPHPASHMRESLVGTGSTSPPRLPTRGRSTAVIASAAAGLLVGVLGVAAFSAYTKPRPAFPAIGAAVAAPSAEGASLPAPAVESASIAAVRAIGSGAPAISPPAPGSPTPEPVAAAVQSTRVPATRAAPAASPTPARPPFMDPFDDGPPKRPNAGAAVRATGAPAASLPSDYATNLDGFRTTLDAPGKAPSHPPKASSAPTRATSAPPAAAAPASEFKPLGDSR